jgi:transcriptional regulator with XRE-family HTH domain
MAERLLRELGDALRTARKRERRSGAALASRAGVSQPTVSRVENGQRVSSVVAVERLIASLPFPPEEAAVLAALQDPRKEVMNLRNLFSRTRSHFAWTSRPRST